ncbi:hypothetical protein [Chlamydia caviae]|uniref:Uncharacterized protein n=1 Tax=Chlamydia caviae (strain ATCC VR-813 / DSM 19441 / 03DC25 / GPIC) TaxID=227941 RepID=Q822Y9_CHLCV|nr:hypothetical protein [Chlamydia caviae]AAP05280.1 conserved hypothetical protein [Chlamydia caviae GPIC]
MACYLTFGNEDISGFSTSQKTSCAVFDLITFPVVSIVISILAWAILLIKIVAKTLKFLFQLITAPCRGDDEVSLRRAFGRLRTEMITEHLILLPLIGSILQGLILVYRADQNGYAELGSLDSAVCFMESSPAYLANLVKW